MIKKIQENILFMVSSRKFVKDLLKLHLEKKGMKVDKEKLNEFVFNTLTDSQIYHFFSTLKLTTNLTEETSKEAFNVFKKNLEKNKDDLNEFIGEKYTNNFLSNLLNINEYGFYSNKDSVEKMISEGIIAKSKKRTILDKIKELMKTDEYIPTSYIPLLVTGVVGGGLGGGIGGSFLATILIYMGINMYERNFSKASKVCVEKFGDEKNICMNKARLESCKREIIELRKLKNFCKKSKNPKNCEKKIDKKINEINIMKINEIKKALERINKNIEEKKKKKETKVKESKIKNK